ncbi:MAG TPA: iduronate-2-sulfatase, partial [Cupriavidus sp.]|nr:iduronate-2-sulfatase [Cupriavidus sp.]
MINSHISMKRIHLLALAFLCLSGGQASQAADRPNVLMIIVDDMNDWVGCLGGHPDVKTPHIDRLAAS